MRTPKYKQGEIVVQKSAPGWRRRIFSVIPDYGTYGNYFGYSYEAENLSGEWIPSPWTIGENSLYKWINK